MLVSRFGFDLGYWLGLGLGYGLGYMIGNSLGVCRDSSGTLLSLTHEGPERHVSCLARHYLANVRKMLWF